MTYLNRSLLPALQRALNQFPAVLVTGPRQSGKTTFLRTELASSHAYVSLDDPLERDFLREDPNGFLDRFEGSPVILDEVQREPDLLRHVKLRIDEERDAHGRWVLTGSQQFGLMQDVSESLAGRVALLELLPFSLREHPLAPGSLAQAIWSGRFPEPALAPDKRDLWLRSYVATYIERDVRSLLAVRDLAAFETFLQALAATHGQLLNAASLSRKVGVTKPTVRSWIGVLEASYVVQLLQPYFENFGKRLVKSPKLHFVEPAVASWLTRQPSADAALSGAMGGALFEGFVVAEAVKAFISRGEKPDLYTWRSHDGLEVDLLVRARGKLLPIEIKLTATPSSTHVRPLQRFIGLAGEQAHPSGALVCRGPEIRPLPGGHTIVPWHRFPDWLAERLA